jgi:predicted aspartyl protease
METREMGKVVVAVRIENLEDVHRARQGAIAPDQIRAVDVPDAVVDTGATMFSMPPRLIKRLGLQVVRTQTARTAAGVIPSRICDSVRLTVQGRECRVEVAEVGEDCPVLVGQIPLESLDFVVDPLGRRLIGNPEHGGQQMYDLF